jgi:hypothetical protein
LLVQENQLYPAFDFFKTSLVTQIRIIQVAVRTTLTLKVLLSEKSQISDYPATTEAREKIAQIWDA